MVKERRIDLTKILKPYVKDNLWVALSPNYSKVVATGKDALKVIESAKNKNIKNPVMIKATEDYSSFVL